MRKNCIKRLPIFALAAISFSSIGLVAAVTTEIEQNPNKLHLCPKPDYSKNDDHERTAHWHNCWGKYKVDLSSDAKGTIYEGEYQFGLPNGQGKYVFPKLGIYVGDIKDGLSNGNGTYTDTKGNRYTGQFVDGSPNGRGTSINEDGRYVGEFREGKKHGRGIFDSKDGSQYSGEYKDGKPHGQGTIMTAAGVRYIGEFRDGNFHGNGTMTDAKGNKFAGEFADNNIHGQGTFTRTDGIKYVGGFKNGQKHGLGTYTTPDGGKYEGEWKDDKKHGHGSFTYHDGKKYVGEWREDKKHGRGTFTSAEGGTHIGEWRNDREHGFGKTHFSVGGKYIGEYKDGKRNGKGIYTSNEGGRYEGIWENDQLVSKVKIDLPITDLDSFDTLSSDSRRETKKNNSIPKIKLSVSNTEPTKEGTFTVYINSNTDTASLQINGEEQGGRADGKYSINKVARAGQETVFTIVATDINGNTDTKTITVKRPFVESQAKFIPLNPAQIRKQPDRDAVAIIIGIADYKNLPRAEFANDDASVFYDYAVRALGIKPENIKLLVDANADDVAIYQAFKSWLPSRVRPTTDVYVYYSGHGLPAEDGKGLYLLPQRAHRDLIEKTAISQQEINGFIQAARPQSVTIFLDSCYSGLARSGETLLASARPVVLKSDKKLFPDNFTVITASQADQISSSSPDLKHGIFSYYLMRGMEGNADADKDGRITVGEMHRYLSEQVARQAGMMNRRQDPQFMGDANRVLVGVKIQSIK